MFSRRVPSLERRIVTARRNKSASQKPPRIARRHLLLETLEDRTLLSGVDVTLFGSDLPTRQEVYIEGVTGNILNADRTVNLSDGIYNVVTGWTNHGLPRYGSFTVVTVDAVTEVTATSGALVERTPNQIGFDLNHLAQVTVLGSQLLISDTNYQQAFLGGVTPINRGGLSGDRTAYLPIGTYTVSSGAVVAGGTYGTVSVADDGTGNLAVSATTGALVVNPSNVVGFDLTALTEVSILGTQIVTADGRSQMTVLNEVATINGNSVRDITVRLPQGTYDVVTRTWGTSYGRVTIDAEGEISVDGALTRTDSMVGLDKDLLNAITVTPDPGYQWAISETTLWYAAPDTIFFPDGTYPLAVRDATLHVTTGTFTVSSAGLSATRLPADDPHATLTLMSAVDLSGRVFDDLDNNGQFDSGDTGIGGVIMQLTGSDQSGPIQLTTVTALDGTYVFEAMGPGTYQIAEVEQPMSWLDGREAAGSLGGIVDNTEDCNIIRDIVIQRGDSEASGYNFAELRPSSLQGLTWDDFDNDGEVDRGEFAIEAVSITLLGTDDRGESVSVVQLTNSQGIFEFVGLRPGTYRLIETQPTAPVVFVDGQDVVGEVNRVPVGDASVNDAFSNIVLPHPGSIGCNYNFGERVDGGQLSTGQAATIGFWQNKNGQSLITSLNGEEQSTLLASWLAGTFPNMYGTVFPAGSDNADVADVYKQIFKCAAKTAPNGPPKLDAQVLAVALSTYATRESLVALHYWAADPGSPTTDWTLVTGVEWYGFNVTLGGLGCSYINVGESGLAFGVADNAQLQVIDLLLATDAMTVNGLLYDDDQDGDAGYGDIDDFEAMLRTLANDVYSAINEQADI